MVQSMYYPDKLRQRVYQPFLVQTLQFLLTTLRVPLNLESTVTGERIGGKKRVVLRFHNHKEKTKNSLSVVRAALQEITTKSLSAQTQAMGFSGQK